jgi:hypothetical protein
LRTIAAIAPLPALIAPWRPASSTPLSKLDPKWGRSAENVVADARCRAQDRNALGIVVSQDGYEMICARHGTAIQKLDAFAAIC